jgi:folate-binding protein YgfZ
VADLSPLQLVEIEIAGQQCFCFRDDHCGVFGIQLLIPTGKVEAVWNALKGKGRLSLVGYNAIDTVRIEAGIPWPLSELNDEALPGETRQLHRAIGPNKGCYLGQEIIERMRTRQSLARRLVLIRFDAPEGPPVGAELVADDRGVGRVTSARHSPKYEAPVALGYVRARHSEDGAPLKARWPDGGADGEVVPFPGKE